MTNPARETAVSQRAQRKERPGVRTGWSPQPSRPQSVAAELVEQVRTALFAGVLKPGDFVGSESQLAKQLGTSRVPVRDAFQALQAMGIVTVKVGVDGGARIASGNPSRFADSLAIQFKLVGISSRELLEAQAAVEGAAAELAATRAGPQDFDELRSILATLQTKIDDPVGFTREGLHFHSRMVEASGNRALVAYFGALTEVLYAAYEPQTTRELALRVVTKHYRVLKLLEAGDGIAARKAVIDHVTQVRDEILRRIEAAGRNPEAAGIDDAEQAPRPKPVRARPKKA